MPPPNEFSAHRAYVFSIGEIILKDTGENLLRNEEVTKAFLET